MNKEDKKEVHKHYHLFPNDIGDNCAFLGVTIAAASIFIIPIIIIPIAKMFS